MKTDCNGRELYRIMKTRIVYPQLWLDEKFATCNVATKLLFCYLINNIQLNLSPYLHITDRQIMFDTGLNSNQLETGKEELSNLGWCYFTENWVFHNHKAAYIDYDGNERVLSSKQKEIDQVPTKIKEVFEGLMLGQRPNINHKSEIINQKSEIGVVKGIEIDEVTLQEIADHYKVPIAFVQSKLEDMILWKEQQPNNSKLRGRNWEMTLRNWVKRDAIQILQKQKGDPNRRVVDATHL